MTRHIPLDKRLLLIERARELHRQGIGYRRIQRILYEEYGIHVHRSTLSYWIRSIHTPYGRIKQLDKTDMDSYAYVIGASIGDAYLRVKKDVEGYMKHLIIMRVRDKEFLEEYNRRLTKIIPGLKPKIKQGRRGFYETTIYNKLLWLEIKKYQEKPEKIYQDLKNHKQHFLKGIYDAEGSVGIGLSRSRLQCSVIIGLTDYSLIKIVSRMLEDLGIKNKIRTIDIRGRKVKIGIYEGRVRKLYYTISFSKFPYLKIFAKQIGFTIKRKQAKLLDYLNIYEVYEDDYMRVKKWLELYTKSKFNRWTRKVEEKF